MQNFKCPPSSPPRINFAFIGSTEQSHLFLPQPFLKTSLLVLMLSHRFLDPFDHILISLCLFCHFGHIECFLTHYIFQMQDCRNRNCLLQLSALSRLLQQERAMHLSEVKKIQYSLEQFNCAKKKQCENYQSILERLTAKLDKYKTKCGTLNEKIKELNDTIRALNSRIGILEDALKCSRDQQHREKTLGLEQIRMSSELKQIIALQESQNKELTVRIRMYEQQIENMQTELALKSETTMKFKNIDFISEDQYQREAELLRQNLKLSFNRTTDELLKTIPAKNSQCTIEQRNTSFPFNQAQEQLRILSNFTQYGGSFILMNRQHQLTLDQSKKILIFIQTLLNKNQQLQTKIENLQLIKDQLTQQMKEKITDIEQIVAIRQTPTFDLGTQTPNNDAIEQLISINGFYRIKIIELQQIMALLTHFAAFLFHVNSYQQKKIAYFKKAAGGKTKRLEPKKANRFKSAALAILFIEYAKKKANKAKRKKISTDSAEVGHAKLQSLLLRCLDQRERYIRKNPALQKLMREKAKVTNQNVLLNFMNIVSQQSIGMSLSRGYQLNSSHFDLNYF